MRLFKSHFGVVVLLLVSTSGVQRATGQCAFEWQEGLQQPGGLVWATLVWDDGNGPKLYVVGDLTIDVMPPGVVENSVLRWDDDHWTPLGGPFTHTSDSYTIVHTLGVYNGELIAAGDFTVAGGVLCDHIARWTGTAWAPLGAGSHGVVYATTVHNGELITAGEPDSPPAAWNGTSWRGLSGFGTGAVRALAVYNGQLIAGGEMSFPATLVTFNGTSWVPFAGGVTGFVYAMAVHNNDLIVGGYFGRAGGTPANMIARWNGTSWSALGSGMGSSTGIGWVGALTTYNNELVAGGRFDFAGGVPANYVARWDGSTWSQFGTGLSNGHSDDEVKGLAVLNGQLAAGGAFWSIQTGSRWWALWAPSGPCDECGLDSDCDDGEFCSGVESCADGLCVSGASPCPVLCRESDDQCVECLDDSDCNDGLFCSGIETCDANGQCQPGAPPCTGGLFCREADDQCVECLSSADCDDGLFCNGVETCSAAGTCQPGSSPCGGAGCDENTDQCEAAPEIWLSFISSTSVPGLGTVADEDIVARHLMTGVWSRVLDGSDVGLSGLVIDGMARLSNGHILLSFTASGSIPGMTGGPSGTTLDDSDIVRFIPTSLGANTAGSFVFYFDGSDVGLTTDNEDIDAIALTSSGQLVISTLGAVSATGASGADTDLLRFNATSLGSVTSGSFVVHFDGSDVGLSGNGNEDVDAAGITSGGAILLSTLGNFGVTGLSGGDEDVIRFTPTNLGGTTSGTYSMFLDLSTLGISSAADVGSVELVD